ncbi:MAG: pyruvate dehydrogenase (acetyl-transferring) E1 component subunit alpha [Gammaproteobacteria bacterium]|nr:MAG: pyruvate dehydrogenase (acetyl-transferring) E1 component subunit alpha [Gammaproteobacteria bacterium]
MTTVAEFAVEYTRFMDETGKLVASPPDSIKDPEWLIGAYRLMVLTRTYDAKAIALQRTGQLGTYASSLGQEAVGTVVGLAMAPEDVLAPTYREQAAQIARGCTMTELLLYWGGDERGSDYQGPREDFPLCVPIATQNCHAVGAAYAFKLRKERRAVVCLDGDGATSKGDFYESTNLAGVWKLPVVFVVNNNQWAISVPRTAQTAAETIAQKAIAAGFEGLQVDGNDPIAIRWATDKALAKAREGDGPTLIEALTYRMSDHTTADDASRYRSDEELEQYRVLDPIVRTRAYLEACGVWSPKHEQDLMQSCEEQVQQAADDYLATPPEPPQAMFDSLYETLPAQLTPQRDAAMQEDGDGG